MVEIADLNDRWAEYAGPGGWNGRTCDNQNKILHLSLQIACHSAVFLHLACIYHGLDFVLQVLSRCLIKHVD